MVKRNRKSGRKTDLFNIVILISILAILSWLVFSLMENIRFTSEIRNKNREISSSKHDFDKLRGINPETVGWITLFDTNIDFPIVQTSNNGKYISTSFYGESAPYGAIFLDYRNSSDFSDMYSLIYGHHMSDGNMFGNVDKFRDKTFFEKSKGGYILTPDASFNASCVAYLEVDCNSRNIYEPSLWCESNCGKLLTWISKRASHINYEEYKKLLNCKPSEVKLVALSTCTSTDENTRSVLILRLEEKECLKEDQS